MFVDIVKAGEVAEVFPCPTYDGGDSVDRFYRILPQATFYSFKSGFVLRGTPANGGDRLILNDVGLPDLNQCINSMVQTGTEVIKCVPKNNRERLRNGLDSGEVINALSRLRVRLEVNAIRIVFAEAAVFGFQLQDVLFGPFYF